MNVIFLSTMYPNTVMCTSGIFVQEQVKALVNFGINIRVFAPVPYRPVFVKKLNKKWTSYDNIPSSEIKNGVQIYHTNYVAIPRGILKDYWSYSYVNSIMKVIQDDEEFKNFDLIHAHGSLPDDYAAYLLSRKLNLPYIVTVHGETINTLYLHKRKFKKSKIALLNADAVVGVSSKVVKKISKLTGRKENLFTVLNGYNRTKFNSPELSSQKELIILFAGNMVKSKGCDYLLKAFSILSKKYQAIKLILAGGGTLLDEMKRLAINLNVMDRVTFNGTMLHADLLELISQCDIFILPSYDEAFGIVYLEAMSFKKPIIGTEGEGICDIVKDNINGLLAQPKNIDSIVSKLEQLIDSPELRIKLGNNGYETVKHLTWDRNALMMSDIYQKVINNYDD